MKSKFDLWLEKVNEERKEYWESKFGYKPYEPLRVDKGRKYIRLWDGTSAWGFVSMVDGVNKGVPVPVSCVVVWANNEFPLNRVRTDV